MEWSWKTIAIIVGLIGVVMIMLDGYRRMRQARAEALRVDVSKTPAVDALEEYNPELPNGTFRVVREAKRHDQTNAQQNVTSDANAEINTNQITNSGISPETSQDKNQAIGEQSSIMVETRISSTDVTDNTQVSRSSTTGSSSSSHTATNAVIPESGRDKEKVEPSLDISDMHFAARDEEDIAILDDPMVAAKQETRLEEPLVQSKIVPRTEDARTQDARPRVDLNPVVPVLLDVEELGDDELVEEAYLDDGIISPARTASRDSSVSSEQGVTSLATAVETPDVEDLNHYNDPHLDEEVDGVPTDLDEVPVNFSGPKAEILADRPDPEMVLIIHTIASNPEGFSGKDLLFLFNSCDLRYGEKNIFHRFEESDGEGCIQFSVAQSHEPGIFEPIKMEQQYFTGLTFFMSLPGAKKPLEAYEAMYEMAMAVSRNLKADVLDSSLSVMTSQAREHERVQILDYERKQQVAAKKAAR